MRLIELRLRNFRQFEGDHSLRLAPDVERNVTVVYGGNGSGKTTLLNAFTWCLYGRVTQDFMFPERLISDGVWLRTRAGDQAQAQVELDFEHNGEHYSLVRTARCARGEGVDEQVPSIDARLQRRTLDGAVLVENPKDFIDAVLPERLHHFFFLNGERFDHLLSADAFQDIDGAIKTILGIELIERGIRHLREVEKRLNSAYRKLGNAEETAILEKLEEAQTRNEKLLQDQADVATRIRHLDEETRVLDNRLRELGGSMLLQRERDELDSRFNSLDSQRKAAIDRRMDLISNKGFLPFVIPAASNVLEKYRDMREQREIPRPIKLQFVEDLLEHGSCVCGTDISQPGVARDKIIAWKAQAGRPELEEQWVGLGSRLGEWSNTHGSDFVDQFQQVTDEIGQIVNELLSVRARLSELSKELESADEEDIRELESARNRARSQRDEQVRRDADIARDLKSTKQVIADLERALREAKAQSQEAEVAHRRLVAAEDVRMALEKMLDLRTDDVREELDKRIKRVYSSVVKKRQVPGISRAFDLTLEEDVEGRLMPKAMSTGEAQVLTLSFVGALADLARETYEQSRSGPINPLASATGGVFPFVADAIFGTLDVSFRREVSRLLPSLAPQVVLCLSKAQSASEVNEELAPRIGAIYVIDARMSRTDVDPESISIDGREFPYVTIEGSDSDHSSLIEVRAPEATHG